MKPEIKENILPMGLIAVALACGGISWGLDGTIFWVMVGASAVLLIAGLFAAMRVDSARRKRE